MLKRRINSLVGNLAAAQVVDFYLDDARAKGRAAIISLVNGTDPAADDLLKRYVREAQSSYIFSPRYFLFIRLSLIVILSS